MSKNVKKYIKMWKMQTRRRGNRSRHLRVWHLKQHSLIFGKYCFVQIFPYLQPPPHNFVFNLTNSKKKPPSNLFCRILSKIEDLVFNYGTQVSALLEALFASLLKDENKSLRKKKEKAASLKTKSGELDNQGDVIKVEEEEEEIIKVTFYKIWNCVFRVNWLGLEFTILSIDIDNQSKQNKTDMMRIVEGEHGAQ